MMFVKFYENRLRIGEITENQAMLAMGRGIFKLAFCHFHQKNYDKYELF